jgi:hypothetical protein
MINAEALLGQDHGGVDCLRTPRGGGTMEDDLIPIANASEAWLLRRGGSTAEWLVLGTVRRCQPGPASGAGRQPAVRHKSAAGGRPASRSTASPGPDLLRRRLREFATVVVHRFEHEISHRYHGRLVLFAACPFLAELMRQLSPAARKALWAVVDADISDLPLPQVAQRIKQAMHAAARGDERPARAGDGMDQGLPVSSAPA